MGEFDRPMEMLWGNSTNPNDILQATNPKFVVEYEVGSNNKNGNTSKIEEYEVEITKNGNKSQKEEYEIQITKLANEVLLLRKGGYLKQVLAPTT